MRKNEGQSEAEILQNRFTSYVTTAIRRQRQAYIQKLRDRQAIESHIEYDLPEPDYDQEEAIFAELPLLMRLENDALLHALREITEKERHIFLTRVLDGKDFEALAVEYGMQYKGITTAYYRTIQKIRRKMREVEK